MTHRLTHTVRRPVLCIRVCLGLLLGMLLTAACTPGQAAANPLAARPLASIPPTYLTPPPPTSLPQQTARVVPTATITPTVYVGVFLGQAQDPDVFVPITTPFFVNEVAALPTPDLSNCAAPVGLDFVLLFSFIPEINAGMGCPIQIAIVFDARTAIYDNGVLYRRPDTRQIWAMTTSSERNRFWYADELILNRVQSSERNDVYRFFDYDPSAEEALGDAQIGSAELVMSLQRFDGGTLLYDASSGQAFALFVDGSSVGPISVADLIAQTR